MDWESEYHEDVYKKALQMHLTMQNTLHQECNEQLCEMAICEQIIVGAEMFRQLETF